MEHATVNTCNSYPWHAWSDGVWRAVFPKTHFGVGVESFMSRLSHRGSETGIEIDVIRLPEQEGVVFRITPSPTPTTAKREGPASDTRRLVHPLTAFIATRCTEAPTARCLTEDLRGAFRDYLAQSGIAPGFTSEAFGRALKIVSPVVERAKQRVNGRLVNTYNGVALKNHITDTKD